MIEWLSQQNHILQALLGTLFTWFVTALGASLVFGFKTINRRVLDVMLGFAAGVMIAASFWSLLAPAIEMASEGPLPNWLPAVAGFLLRDEILYFHKSMEDPARPLAALIGGAKVSSKLGALVNLLKNVDKMIIGGAMANTFLKAKGYDVGQSLVDDKLIKTAENMMAEARKRGVKFYLPVDVVVADRLDRRAQTKITPVQEVPPEWIIADIGPATVTLFGEALQNAQTIIWNGPMGAFELDPFSRGTMAMVHKVADLYALTIVGGGDTDVALHKAGEFQKFSYVSTGGGAFIEFLEGKKLPGVKALEDWAKRHPNA